MGAPNLRTVDAELPDPPYPADTKTKGWRFELDMQRILASDTWAITPPHLRGQLLLVWALSFEQRPPASWPNNHAIIAAHIGMDERQFSAHSDILLRGFILHSDGRLYHPIVIERVEKLLGYRVAEKERKAAYRAAKLAEKKHGNVPRVSHGTPVVSHGCPTGVRTQEQEQEQEPVLEEKKEKDNRLVDLAAPIDRASPESVVFVYWQETMGHKRAKLDAKRKRAITARLREGHTVDEIKQAIDGCKASPWHQGKNDRQAKFDDIELICRDAVKLDRFRAAADQAAQQSNELDDWLNEDKIIEGSFNVVG